jgi:hypothetical protein
MKKGLLPALILVAALVMAEGVIGQDPGAIDSLVFGNPDGTPILVNLDVDVSVPIWIKCDENVAFVNLSLATQNEYVSARLGGVPIGPLMDWDLQFQAPANNWPSPGLTSQTFLGIADFALPVPNYINTNGQWVLIGAFKIHTTSNPSALGHDSYLSPGEDPTQGLTVIFDEFWNPIVPRMRFSVLRFLSTANPPQIISPVDNAQYTINGPFPFSIPFIATDPDTDYISLNVDFPYPFTLTPIQSVPGYANYNFTWVPPLDLRTDFTANFIAVDADHATDVNTIRCQVRPMSLVVSTDSTFPGYPATLEVAFNGLGDNATVAGFNILFVFDPLSLSVDSVEFLDSIVRWEYKNVTRNPIGDGSLRMIGIANLHNQGAPLLKSGNHKIARVKFYVSNDPGFVGMFLPITMPDTNLSSNVVSDSTGYLVFHPAIMPGGIKVLSPDSYLLGDVNLNGDPFEIGDVVVLSEFLSDPISNPLNPIQLAAADCNQDGIRASIADLIYMLGVLNGIIPYPRALPDLGPAEIEIVNDGVISHIHFKSNIPIGGALIKLNYGDAQIDKITAPAGFVLKSSNRDGTTTILVYSENAQSNLAGQTIDIKMASGTSASIGIQYQEISDIYGRLMK